MVLSFLVPKRIGWTRPWSLFALTTFLCLASAHAQFQAKEDWRFLVRGKDPHPQWARNIQKKMEMKISFDFVDTPIADVVAFLTNLTGMNMVLDPAAVEANPIPITLKVTDMRFASAFDWIFRAARLDFVLRDEAIFISTRERLDREVLTRAYDVSVLVGRNDLASILPGTGPALREEGTQSLSLVNSIRSTIEPETWDREGRKIAFGSGHLFVRNNIDVQLQVSALLEFLEAPSLRVLLLQAYGGLIHSDAWEHLQDEFRSKKKHGSARGLPVFFEAEEAGKLLHALQLESVSVLCRNKSHAAVQVNPQVCLNLQPVLDLAGQSVNLEVKLWEGIKNARAVNPLRAKPRPANSGLPHETAGASATLPTFPPKLDLNTRLPLGVLALVSARMEQPGKIEVLFLRCHLVPMQESNPRPQPARNRTLQVF